MFRRKPDVRPFMRSCLLSAGFILALTVIPACGGKEAIPLPSESSTLTPEPTIYATPVPTPTPTEYLPYTYPLTGVATKEQALNRPFMIMVENAPAARPQSGLHRADIVYEVLAEGEITRFLSVFQSDPAEIIGPVRSMRPYFVELGVGLDAMLVHAGWSQDAMNMMVKLKAAHLDEVYGDGDAYWRSEERKAPHNLYTSIAKATGRAERRNFRMEWTNPLFYFAAPEQQVTTGQPARTIHIPYLLGYEVDYLYDEEAGLYKRNMAGSPHLDKESGEQITAKNVLVIEAKHRILDDVGRRSVDVNGPGKGVVFQQGKAQEITWTRADGIIRAYNGENEVPLLPGKTWVQIVPPATETTWE